MEVRSRVMFSIPIIDKSRPIIINDRMEGYEVTTVEIEANSYNEAIEIAVYNNYEPCTNKL